MAAARLASLLAIAVPSAAAGQTQPAPFSLQDVDFTSTCDPNPALARLLAVAMGRQPASDGDQPAFDRPVLDAVSGDGRHVLRFDRAASWHGLRLVEVRLVHGIERGPTNYTLVFADDPQKVRSVWTARGWSVPPPGETRVIADAGGPVSFGLQVERAMTAVTCFHD